MLKCEINKNIVTQNVEIYLIDRDFYFTYESDGEIKSHKRESYTVGCVKPFILLPYDIWEPLKEAFKQELNVEKIEGSASHIKDLRWILGHFLDKDTR